MFRKKHFKHYSYYSELKLINIFYIFRLALANIERLVPQLGCALTFASEAKFEIDAKILFRFEAKKKPDFT